MRPKQRQHQRPPAATCPSSSSPPPPPPVSSSSSWYSHHCNDRFFSSLRQLEHRLASENTPSSCRSPPQRQKRSSDERSEPFPSLPPPSSSPSYSAPLFFVDCRHGRAAQPHLAGSAGAAGPLPPDSSDSPPLELFSDSILREPPPSTPAEGGCPPSPPEDAAGDLEGDVERLMELLGLSEFHRGGVGDGDGNDERGLGGWGLGGDRDAGEFLSRVAGVKGPKCRREMERLDGWIRYYSAGDGRGAEAKREPARLAHLLLARAACAGGGGSGSDCFGGMAGVPRDGGGVLAARPASALFVAAAEQLDAKLGFCLAHTYRSMNCVQELADQGIKNG